MIIHEDLPVYLDTEAKKMRIEDKNTSSRNRVIADLELEDSGESIDTSGARIYNVTGRVFIYEREKVGN
jgi:hypothetical protein